MKRIVVLVIASQLGFVSEAMSSPCVSDTFDLPLPGATDVVSHISDVPSVQFPGFWQEGRIEGFSYKMFSNAEAEVRPASQTEDWGIQIRCDVSGGTCTLANTGIPPQDATRIAGTLGECLIRADVTANDFAPPPTTEPVSVIDVAEVEIPATLPTAPCGLAAVNETTDVATMQRLLTLAGSNPGPVDGFIGAQTFRAMDDFVEDSGWDTSISDMIALLDALLCDRTQ